MVEMAETAIIAHMKSIIVIKKTTDKLPNSQRWTSQSYPILMFWDGCEHHFELDDTPEDNKVKTALISLDEKAWSWHKSMKITWFGIHPTWVKYVKALKQCFRPIYKTPLGDLMQLQQKGSLANFNDVFDSVACKLDFAKICWLKHT